MSAERSDHIYNNFKMTLKWGLSMEYELEEVERDYIEFRKEMREE
jgi:hypothetical protein